MTSKVIEGPKSSSNFSVNPTLPLIDGPLMLPHELCVFLSISFSIPLYLSYSFSISLSTSLFCSMQTFFYVAWFLMIFRSFDQITTLFFGYASIPIIPTFFAWWNILADNFLWWFLLKIFFNLNLRSYGQLFVLVLCVATSNQCLKSCLIVTISFRYILLHKSTNIVQI